MSGSAKKWFWSIRVRYGFWDPQRPWMSSPMSKANLRSFVWLCILVQSCILWILSLIIFVLCLINVLVYWPFWHLFICYEHIRLLTHKISRPVIGSTFQRNVQLILDSGFSLDGKSGITWASLSVSLINPSQCLLWQSLFKLSPPANEFAYLQRKRLQIFSCSSSWSFH